MKPAWVCTTCCTMPWLFSLGFWGTLYIGSGGCLYFVCFAVPFPYQLLPEKPATNCRVAIISCNNSRFRCNHCADRKAKIIPDLCVWTYRTVQRWILFPLCCITMCLTNITSPCFDIFILWLTNWTGLGGESNFNLLFFVTWKDINLGGYNSLL